MSYEVDKKSFERLMISFKRLFNHCLSYKYCYSFEIAQMSFCYFKS